MKKILVLLACCLALYIYKNQNDSYDYNYPNLITQAVKKSDWTTAARLSQRVLLEEVDLELRWEALQYTVLASKNLGDLTWAITALENSILDYTSHDKQEYIYTELMYAYKGRMNNVKAREAATSLLAIPILTPENRANIEFAHAQFSIAISDFANAEKMLLSTLSRENMEDTHHLANFMLASIYYYDDKMQECEVYIDQFLALPHTDPSKIGQALFIKADIAEINEKYDLASELYHQALDLHPNPDTINIRLKNLGNLINTTVIYD